MTQRELAAVLAGLRLLQFTFFRERFTAAPDREDILDIASDGGGFDMLSSEEIEDLCQRLNLGDTHAQPE